MFSKFLLIVGLIVGLFLAGGFFLPRYVHVERSLEIERPAAPVFALLNSYKTFASWSPWAERDPDARYEFTGPETGVGARMSWSGDPRLVGSGWQEIIESVPHSLVRTRLFFDQQGAAESYFQLDETEKGVMVTWGFDTDLADGQSFLGGLLARYFGLMFDRWIGSDYEQGLSRLKVYAESLPVSKPPKAEIEVVEVEPQTILFVRVGEPGDDELDNGNNLIESLDQAFGEITAYMAEHAIVMAGRPMVINHSGGGTGYELLAAIPVETVPDETTPDEPAERIMVGMSPAGPAVRIIHRGPYSGMVASYQKLSAYMDVHDLTEGDYSWEHYISDPAETPDNELVTHIFYQVAP
jgi:effector-binding domain-containing protein